MGVQAATHWDALSHASYGGRLYNGIDAGVIDDRVRPGSASSSSGPW